MDVISFSVFHTEATVIRSLIQHTTANGLGHGSCPVHQSDRYMDMLLLLWCLARWQLKCLLQNCSNSTSIFCCISYRVTPRKWFQWVNLSRLVKRLRLRYSSVQMLYSVANWRLNYIMWMYELLHIDN